MLRLNVFLRLSALLLLAAAIGGCTTPPPKPEVKREPIFYPPPPDEARIQFLYNFHGTVDFARPVSKGGFWEFLVGAPPPEADFTVTKPYGIAMANHKIFVTDTVGDRIGIFDVKNEEAMMFGRAGRGALKKPVNIRIGSDHLMYVADSGRKQVVVFDESGRYVTEYGDGKTIRPIDALPMGDELYVLNVLDTKTANELKDNAQDVLVFDMKTHVLKRTIGKRGTDVDAAMFNYPNCLAGDTEGNLYVCDAMNFRIKKFDPSGKMVHTFGQAGDTVGTFARPRGVTVDRQGIIYVIDSKSHVVQMFNKEGKTLMGFGGLGQEDGKLFLPAQVTLDYDHVEDFRKYIDPNFDAEYLVLVTNQYGPNKVSIFAFGRLRTQPAASATAAPSPTASTNTPVATPAPVPSPEKK
jgi:DNA-binding beta-propeller fold protein YncE